MQVMICSGSLFNFNFFDTTQFCFLQKQTPAHTATSVFVLLTVFKHGCSFFRVVNYSHEILLLLNL